MNTSQLLAVANADAHANDAGLPRYSELHAMLQTIVNRATRPLSQDSTGQPMVSIRAALLDEAKALINA